jgi:hypothetical protein
MSSWLTDLENQKKKTEQEKAREEQAQKTEQELEEAKTRQLFDQNKDRIEFIRERVKQLVSRANAVGLTKLEASYNDIARGPVHVIRISYCKHGIGHLDIRTYTVYREINIYLDENGQLQLYYRLRMTEGRVDKYGFDANEYKSWRNTIPPLSVTEQVMNEWVESVATCKGFSPNETKKGVFARLFD